MRYAICDNITGEILRYGNCQIIDWPLQFDPVTENIYSVFPGETVSDATHYVDLQTDEIVEKTNFPLQINKTTILADSVDACIISNVPVGTRIKWDDGLRQTIDDGVVELSVSQPGIYTIRFQGAKHLQEEISIEAINPA